MIYEFQHLLSSGDFAQTASDVCERRTLFSRLVPTGLDQPYQRFSKFGRLRQHRPIGDALTVTDSVHHVCNDISNSISTKVHIFWTPVSCYSTPSNSLTSTSRASLASSIPWKQGSKGRRIPTFWSVGSSNDIWLPLFMQKMPVRFE